MWLKKWAAIRTQPTPGKAVEGGLDVGSFVGDNRTIMTGMFEGGGEDSGAVGWS
jgi:hypothetical protein